MEWVVMGRVRILKIDDDGVMIGCINMDILQLNSKQMDQCCWLDIFIYRLSSQRFGTWVSLAQFY